MKHTVIVGASPNSSRYAYRAAEMLSDHNHPISLLGVKKGVVFGKEILDIRTKPELKNVDTITLYIGPARQPEWYDYLLHLKPKRIIFNPGTENGEFERLASLQRIEIVEGCTLVMLRTNQY